MARAVIADRRDLVAAGGIGVAPGHLGKDVTAEIGFPVIEIAQGKGEIGHRGRAIERPRKAGAGIDDIDGAQRQAFVQVGLLAQRRGRENLDRMAAFGALLEQLRGLFGGGLQRVADFVDMRELQHIGKGGAAHQARGQGNGPHDIGDLHFSPPEFHGLGWVQRQAATSLARRSLSQSNSTPMPGVEGATARRFSSTSGRWVYSSIGKLCTSIQPALGRAETRLT